MKLLIGNTTDVTIPRIKCLRVSLKYTYPRDHTPFYKIFISISKTSSYPHPYPLHLQSVTSHNNLQNRDKNLNGKKCAVHPHCKLRKTVIEH